MIMKDYINLYIFTVDYIVSLKFYQAKYNK